MRYLAIALVLLSLAAPASAQDEPARRPAPKKDGPWFGITLPPKANAAPAVKVGARAPRPAIGEPAAEFNGTAHQG